MSNKLGPKQTALLLITGSVVAMAIWFVYWGLSIPNVYEVFKTSSSSREGLPQLSQWIAGSALLGAGAAGGIAIAGARRLRRMTLSVGVPAVAALVLAGAGFWGLNRAKTYSKLYHSHLEPWVKPAEDDLDACNKSLADLKKANADATTIVAVEQQCATLLERATAAEQAGRKKRAEGAPDEKVAEEMHKVIEGAPVHATLDVLKADPAVVVAKAREHGVVLADRAQRQGRARQPAGDKEQMGIGGGAWPAIPGNAAPKKEDGNPTPGPTGTGTPEAQAPAPAPPPSTPPSPSPPASSPGSGNPGLSPFEKVAATGACLYYGLPPTVCQGIIKAFNKLFGGGSNAGDCFDKGIELIATAAGPNGDFKNFDPGTMFEQFKNLNFSDPKLAIESISKAIDEVSHVPGVDKGKLDQMRKKLEEISSIYQTLEGCIPKLQESLKDVFGTGPLAGVDPSQWVKQKLDSLKGTLKDACHIESDVSPVYSVITDRDIARCVLKKVGKHEARDPKVLAELDTLIDDSQCTQSYNLLRFQ